MPVKKNAKQKNTASQNTKGTTIKAKKKQRNYLLWVTLVIIAIPCIVLLYIIIGSRESSDTPVEGSRFKHSLDPEITEQDITSLKDSLSLEGVESVEVNLKSATLRISLNTSDDLSQEQIQGIMTSAYDIVVEKLPVDTYFANKTVDDQIVKMYDLEINAYNYIPTSEEEKGGQIHLSRVKNAAAENVVDDVLTSPKDEETSNEILNPDTSNPPTSGESSGNVEGE